MFSFLIAGLSLIRLKDKSKLIKYVDTRSAFLWSLSKFWNAAIRFDFTPCGSLGTREIGWGRPAAGPAVEINDCPVSIFGFLEHSMVFRTPPASGKPRGFYDNVNLCKAYMALTKAAGSPVHPHLCPLQLCITLAIKEWGKWKETKTGWGWGHTRQPRDCWFSFQLCS